jgi:NAD+ diphosphatase
MKEKEVIKPSPKKLHRDSDEDIWILFKNNRAMLFNIDGEYRFPQLGDIKRLNIEISYIQCIGDINGLNLMCGEVENEIENDEIEYMDLMTIAKQEDELMYTLASKGSLFLNWLKLNKCCGVCGSENYLKDSYTERALVCSKCGNTTWPRTSPAVIVAVTREDKLLLVYNKQFPERKYSVIAGFVEYGETFEDCVKREVYEEAGIKVKNIKYFGSQPWPFPNSMMVAFTAEYLEGEIRPDGEEISQAGWFSKDEVKEKYIESFSIGSKLIQWFLDSH